MPSIRSQPSRSISPSPPRENTALLAPSTPTHAHGFQKQSHLRKASVGGRSVSGRSTAGSIRGYGTVNGRPGPASQAPRVSKLGQRVRPSLISLELADNVEDLDYLAYTAFILCFSRDGVSIVLLDIDIMGKHVLGS